VGEHHRSGVRWWDARLSSVRVRLGARMLLLRNLILCLRVFARRNAELLASLQSICVLRSGPLSGDRQNSGMSLTVLNLISSTLLVGYLQFAS